MLIRLALAALLAVPCVLNAAATKEEYEAKLEATDLSNPDQLFILGQWCKDNGYNFKASRHFKAALKLDPDHQATRDALGFVWYDKKWTHKSRVPGGLSPEEQEETKQATRRGAGTGRPGPSAADVDWDLTIPAFAKDGHAKWLAQFTDKMNRTDNYSNEMDSSWRTLLLPEYIDSAVAAMATALMDPGFKDLYGPVMLSQELMKTNEGVNISRARRLLPFMVKASERVKDPEELYYFAMFAGAIGDKRATPRLIQLLSAGGEAAEGAKAGLSMITLIPEDEVNQDNAQAWWNRWHSSSDGEIFGAQLESDDPMARIAACRRLYPEQDRRIVPTLIDILEKHHEGAAKHGAVDMLKEITGNDWDLSGDLDPKAHKERVERLEDWWDEEGNTFVFLEFRGQMTTGGGGPVKRDKREIWIGQLSSLDPDEARAAFDGLLGEGDNAVPMLIKALEASDGIRAGKARDLLRQITRQNFGFEPVRGSNEERKAALQKWQAWAAEQQGDQAEGDDVE